MTGLRFFAALFVVTNHMLVLGGASFGGFDRLASLGYLGVQFFFVLSGFVLMWSLRSADRPTAFYRRRFARIYPLYLAFLLVGAMLLLAGAISVSAGSIVLSVFLLQAWWPSSEHIDGGLNGPGWSLSDEAFFYALFPFLAGMVAGLDRRRVIVVGGSLLIAVVATALVLHEKGALPAGAGYAFPVLRLPEFVVGMALAALLQGRTVRMPSLFVASAIAGAALIALAAISPSADRGAVGLVTLPFCALLIAAAAQADRVDAPSPFRHPLAVKLGVWSYALYLAHGAVLVIWVKYVAKDLSSDTVVAVLEYVGIVLVMIAVAGLAHRYVEAPLERRLRGSARPSALQQQDAETALLAGSR
ncbi:MAG TPA: acyltransferase [Thermoleophilaceae bacterium]